MEEVAELHTGKAWGLVAIRTSRGSRVTCWAILCRPWLHVNNGSCFHIWNLYKSFSLFQLSPYRKGIRRNAVLAVVAELGMDSLLYRTSLFPLLKLLDTVGYFFFSKYFLPLISEIALSFGSPFTQFIFLGPFWYFLFISQRSVLGSPCSSHPIF